MKIKQLLDVTNTSHFNKYEQAVLQYNNIKEEDVESLFPDIGIRYNFDDYFKLMQPIVKGDEFVDFIEKHKTEKFCVVGDYDCDGIMATSIMSYGLIQCGIDCVYICPNRFNDGYGMKKNHVDSAIKSKATIIITVDNGISSNDVIDYAHEHNIKVVVTDHHLSADESHADLCIDPYSNADEFKDISGATVAFKLIYLLYKKYNFNFIKDFASMAAITVQSDVMPCVKENRILLKAFYQYANEQMYVQNTFINRLFKLLSFYDPKNKSDPYLNLKGLFRPLTIENINFYLIPVINSANRVVGDVNDLVYNIMSLFHSDFDGMPNMYYNLNRQRIFMKSELNRLHQVNDETKAVVEVLNPGKYENNYSGITGLVASTIVETENKPALIGVDLGTSDVHFSGRSVSGFDLYEALNQIKNEHPDLSFTFGGHAEALGATCDKSKTDVLQQYLSEKFDLANILQEEKSYLNLKSEDIEGFQNAYMKLWPFGSKFEFPKFYIEGQINYYFKENNAFSLKTYGNQVSIKFYGKDIQDRISNYAFKNRNHVIKGIAEFQENDNMIMLKLDELL